MDYDEKAADLERLIARYEERGVPSEWQEVTPRAMAPAFRLFIRSLPSPSADVIGADESEQLIHDPLAALQRAGIVPEGETPRISTMVVNHEQTLRRFIMHAMVVASTNPSTVGITIVKEPWRE
jgi:hypothetical protein